MISDDEKETPLRAMLDDIEKVKPTFDETASDG